MHFPAVSSKDHFPEPESDTAQLEAFTNSISNIIEQTLFKNI